MRLSRRHLLQEKREDPWKGIYSAVSLIGFVVLIHGFGIARQSALSLRTPPAAAKMIGAALTLPAFILLFAAYVPGTRIKKVVEHPMVLVVKTWAVAHLLAMAVCTMSFCPARSSHGRSSTSPPAGGAIGPRERSMSRDHDRAMQPRSSSAGSRGWSSRSGCTAG